MFRGMAGVAQTELNYGCCITGKTLIFSKKLHKVLFNLHKNKSFCCTDYNRLILVRRNVALISLHNLCPKYSLRVATLTKILKIVTDQSQSCMQFARKN